MLFRSLKITAFERVGLFFSDMGYSLLDWDHGLWDLHGVKEWKTGFFVFFSL